MLPVPLVLELEPLELLAPVTVVTPVVTFVVPDTAVKFAVCAATAIVCATWVTAVIVAALI